MDARREQIKMGVLEYEYYLPVMVMILIQIIYAGMTLGTRTALLKGMSPAIFVVYRQAFGTIVIAPIAFFSGRNSGSYFLNLRSFSLIFLTSLIGVTLNQNLFFEGTYLASSSVASAMANLIPAITFLIAALLGMEKVNIRSKRSIAKIVGTVVSVSGAVTMALLKGSKLLNGDGENKSLLGLGSDHQNWLLGCLFLFGGCCAWSVWLILQVPAYKSHPNYLSLSAWMCLMSLLQSVAVAVFLEKDPNAWKINSLLELGCTLYAGVMGSAVTFCLQVWCISKRGPLFSAMFNPLSTFIVIVLAALLLHEEIYIGSLIGLIGVIFGLYVVLWGKAEEDIVVDVKEKTEPKSIEEVGILINESSKNEYCKTNLQEPFLNVESSSN